MIARGVIILIISIFFISPIFAQEQNDQFYDMRVKKLLDSKDINYTITKNNNFKINLITEDEPQKRTQIVLIYSKTDKYDDYEVREVSSTSFTIPKKESKELIFIELLKENSSLKTGTWSIMEFNDSPEVYTITFSVKVSSNMTGDDLRSIINLVGIEADRIEKLYANGKDEY